MTCTVAGSILYLLGVRYSIGSVFTLQLVCLTPFLLPPFSCTILSTLLSFLFPSLSLHLPHHSFSHPPPPRATLPLLGLLATLPQPVVSLATLPQPAESLGTLHLLVGLATLLLLEVRIHLPVTQNMMHTSTLYIVCFHALSIPHYKLSGLVGLRRINSHSCVCT